MLDRIFAPKDLKAEVDRDLETLAQLGLANAAREMWQCFQRFQRDLDLPKCLNDLGMLFYRLKLECSCNKDAADFAQDRQYYYFGLFFYADRNSCVDENNSLKNYFYENQLRPAIHKWMHYFEIYDKHFSKFRGREIVVLEIGVSKGGSLGLWRSYFGEKAEIYGVDIDPDCKRYSGPKTRILIGDQGDPSFLRFLAESIPSIDILIDDGGHRMNQQIATFEALYNCIKPGGVYLCEDCHTSYWPDYDGAYLKDDTFIEYSKRWIDSMNAWHSRDPKLQLDAISTTANCISFYDSVVAIEKTEKYPPFSQRIGWYH